MVELFETIDDSITGLHKSLAVTGASPASKKKKKRRDFDY